ncbi:hypothetical protein SAMN06295885_2076 [Rathayibacter oskolensis]|uniref:Uncharacterized protein n=1 Tax=Rathayibacter oskolensis TaxID=1891671 RepID=A0A1X7NYE8_9MICO|nr:hypothetical protein [Rathayibacter oskolensis]SMH42845.1 hypothetical protein SAMN06295885_2076 [Rathayibacter oskolensis]
MDARRRLLVAAGAVAAVLVAGAVVLDVSAGSPAGGDASSSRPIGASETPAPGAAATAQATGAASPGVPASVSPPTPAAPVAAADPSAPLEVSGPAPVETGLPSSAPRAALIALPLPAAASADRAVVAGYPSDVVAPLPGSIVASSSVEPAGEVLRSGLTATVALTAEQITEQYRSSLAERGFTSAAVEAPEGGSAMLFTAGQDTVSLAVAPTGTPRMSYSLLSVLHAPSGG